MGTKFTTAARLIYRHRENIIEGLALIAGALATMKEPTPKTKLTPFKRGKKAVKNSTLNLNHLFKN